MHRLLLVTTSVLCLVLAGCQATSGKKPAQERHSNANKPWNKGSKSGSISDQASKKVEFKQKAVANKEVKKADQAFETVSLKEYRLKQHLLYQTEFTNDILFATDKSETQSLSAKDIQAFAALYRSGQLGKNIYVVGHTDSRGADNYNLTLSLKRALFVANLFFKHGVKAESIKLVPAGEFLPRAKNTRGLYRQNRRVEVISSDSKALIAGFLRQRDCSSIDSACKKAMLPVMSVKKGQNGLAIRKEKQGDILTGAPEANNLGKLADDLTRLGETEVDKREAAITEEQRGKMANIKTRNLLSLEVLIRPQLSFREAVRKRLTFPKQHILK